MKLNTEKSEEKRMPIYFHYIKFFLYFWRKENFSNIISIIIQYLNFILKVLDLQMNTFILRYCFKKEFRNEHLKYVFSLYFKVKYFNCYLILKHVKFLVDATCGNVRISCKLVYNINYVTYMPLALRWGIWGVKTPPRVKIISIIAAFMNH